MKLMRFFRLTLAVALVLCCSVVTAFAAQQPCIVLRGSGVRNQYTLRLDAFSSNFESVQFDIVVDRQVAAPQVTWRDDSPAHFQEIRTSQSGDKTVLTVYIDRLRPIANSGSVDLAELTFDQALPATAFSAGEIMTALDKDQAATVYPTPVLNVIQGTANSAGGAGSNGSTGGAGSSNIIDWEKVSGDVAENGGKKTLTVRVHSGETVSPNLFRQAAERKLLLRLDYGDYFWTFDTAGGVEIPAERIYYDLSVDAMHYRNLSAAVENSDIAQLETAYSGSLPCNAVLSWPVDEEHAGKDAYLSCYNENATRLEYRAGVKVTGDGMAELPLTRGGKYVVSLRNFWGQPAATTPTGTVQTFLPESIPEVVVPPEDEVTESQTTSAPAPASEETPVASLQPEEAAQPERGGLPGWVLPLAGVLVLAAGGAFIFFQFRGKRNNDYRQ